MAFLIVEGAQLPPVYTLDSELTSIVIPAGLFVHAITIVATKQQYIDISQVSQGGTDIEEQLELPEDESATVAIHKRFDAGGTLYFAGYDEPISVTLYSE